MSGVIAVTRIAMSLHADNVCVLEAMHGSFLFTKAKKSVIACGIGHAILTGISHMIDLELLVPTGSPS